MIETITITNALGTPLTIGKAYWILDGSLKPIYGQLTGFNAVYTVAYFGGISRKVDHVYISEEQAIQIGIY